MLGYTDEGSQLSQVRETSNGPQVSHTVPDYPRLLLQEGIDVPPHTLAHMQAQGRASATSTEELDKVHREERLDGDRDSLLEEGSFRIPSQGGTAELICAYPWPQGCYYWIAVAVCESTLGTDPWAYDERNPYTGLYQVWEGHGYGYAWLIDDRNNVLAAWELSHEGTRTSPWPYCQWQ